MKKLSKIISIFLIISMLALSLPVNVFSSTTVRTSYPSSSESTWYCYSTANPYTVNPNTGGNCTWYAYGRAMEVCGVALSFSGNAGEWYSKAKAAGYSVGSEPRENSIICWRTSTYGHVAFVEKVEGGYVTWTESNYYKSPFNKVTSNHPWTYCGNDSLIGYIYLSQSAPTWASITASATTVAKGGSITFSISSDTATSYTIGIDCNNTRVLTQNVGNTFTYTCTQAGSYSAYVSASNSAGGVDSARVSWVVEEKPTWASITASATKLSKGESITFNISSDTATSYTIGIDCNNTRVLTQNVGNTFTYTCTQAGSYSAYVSASNSAGGLDSDRVFWIVEDKPISIAVESLPCTNYYEGELLSTAGLKLKLIYSDGSTKIVDSGYTCSEIKKNFTGYQQITVTYEGLTTRFDIYVNEVNVTRMSINTGPDKTTYRVGESFDPTGIVVFVTYSTGSKDFVSTGFSYDKITFDAPGTYSVNLYYDFAVTTVEVTVIDDNAEILYGDVNSDGIIDGLDATRLLQYLAEWDVEIDSAAADVYNDGVIDGLDVTTLLKYLAEWDVVLGQQ